MGVKAARGLRGQACLAQVAGVLPVLFAAAAAGPAGSAAAAGGVARCGEDALGHVAVCGRAAGTAGNAAGVAARAGEDALGLVVVCGCAASLAAKAAKVPAGVKALFAGAFAAAAPHVGGLFRFSCVHGRVRLAQGQDHGPGFRRVQQLFQRKAHLGGRSKAPGGVRRAGFAQDGVQRGGGVHRPGQLQPGQPLALGHVPVLGGQRLRVRRVEGQTTLVQAAVEHQTQRVGVHAGVVGLACLEHFRGHVAGRAHLGQRAGAGQHGAGHAEIAQLVVAVRRDEDVLGLDVAVDDVVPLAQFQRAAQVDAHAHHLAPGHLHGALQVDVQRGEQLHADEDIPADAVFVGDDLVVLVAHDVALGLELAHQLDLVGDGVRAGAIVRRNAVAGEVVGLNGGAQVVFRLGQADDLQRAGVHGAQRVPPLDLEHSAVTARADAALDAPLAKERRVFFVIRFRSHDTSSLFGSVVVVNGDAVVESVSGDMEVLADSDTCQCTARKCRVTDFCHACGDGHRGQL